MFDLYMLSGICLLVILVLGALAGAASGIVTGIPWIGMGVSAGLSELSRSIMQFQYPLLLGITFTFSMSMFRSWKYAIAATILAAAAIVLMSGGLA